MGSLFSVTYIVWGLSEIILNRLTRSTPGDKQNADKNSLAIIWITVVVAMTLAIYISSATRHPIHDNYAMPYIGLALVWLGVILRLTIIKTLGQFFTVDVTIRKDHKLKTDGFYKYLRHPSYSASLLSFLGFGVSLNNWISLILIVTAIVIVFKNRINIEEKALIAYFGEEYLEYKAATKAIIPFVY